MSYKCELCGLTPDDCKCHRDRIVHYWTDGYGRAVEQVEWLGPRFILEIPKQEKDDSEWIPFP